MKMDTKGGLMDLGTTQYIQDLSISGFGDPSGDTKDNGVGSFPVPPALAHRLLPPSPCFSPSL